jgi:uroporphyrinogen III methyltransferase/synthase
LQALHLLPNLQAERFSSEGIVEEFRKVGLRGKNVLLARSDLADDTLPSSLESMGAKVKDIACYRTVMGQPDESAIADLIEGKIDVVTFTSASTARNFTTILGDDFAKIPKKTLFASIGPVTTRVAKEAGMEIHIEAGQYTIPHLLAAIQAHFRNHPAGT